jgi:hypothetical protein
MTAETEEQGETQAGDATTQAADFPTVEVVDQSDVLHHPGADPDASDPNRAEPEPAAAE